MGVANLVAAKCTNCDAILDVDFTKDAIICDHCKCAIIVQKAIEKHEIEVRLKDPVEVKGISTADKLWADYINAMNCNDRGAARRFLHSMTTDFYSDYRGWMASAKMDLENLAAEITKDKYRHARDVTNFHMKCDNLANCARRAITVASDAERESIRGNLKNFADTVLGEKIIPVIAENKNAEILLAESAIANLRKEIKEKRSLAEKFFFGGVVAVVLLIVNIAMPNWWLLLTIPGGLGGICLLLGVLVIMHENKESERHIADYIAYKDGEISTYDDRKMRPIHEFDNFKDEITREFEKFKEGLDAPVNSTHDYAL